jgi:hypothetical protein
LLSTPLISQLDVVIKFLDRNGDGMIDLDEWSAVYK